MMESYVSRHEFENALKEVRRLQVFLADTFGSKFMEFFKEDKFTEIDTQLKKQLGNWTIKLDPKPSSIVVIPVEKKGEKLKSNVPISPPSGSPHSLVPIIVNTTSVRTATPPLENNRGATGVNLDIIPVVDLNKSPIANREKFVRKKVIPPILPPTISSRPPVPPLIPNSILPTLSSSLTPPPPPLPPPLGPSSSKNLNSTNSLTITECITLDDEEDDDEKKPSLSTSKKQNHSLISHHANSNRNGAGERISSVFVDQSSRKAVDESPSTSAPLNVPGTGRNSFNPWPSSSPPSQKRRAVSTNFGNDKMSVVDSHTLPSFTNSISTITNETPPPPLTSTSPNLISGDEIIPCEECHLYFFSSQMAKHLLTHDGSKNGSSGEGDGAGGGKQTLSSSYTPSTVSIFEQTFTCPLCFKEYPNFHSYETHCNEFHKEGKPCPVCKKLLGHRSTLKRHMSCHEDRKFVCGACGKGYNRRDNLVAHQKIHKDGKEPPTAFYCLYCKCAFASKEGRDKHMNDLHCYDGTGEEGSNSGEHWNISQTLGDGHDGGSVVDVIPSGDLIDIGPDFKVDVSLSGENSYQFEYEGDDDEEEVL